MTDEHMGSKHGFTMIPNELLEVIVASSLSRSQYQIVFYVMRCTFGYQKDTDNMSFGQIATATRIQRRNVIRTVRDLAAMNILSIEKSGQFVRGGELNRVGINKNHDEWATGVNSATSDKSTTSVTKDTSQKDTTSVNRNTASGHKDTSVNPRLVSLEASTSVNRDTRLVSSVTPTKEIQKKPKERGMRERPKDLPATIDQQLWSEFVEHRKHLKKPLTDAAANRLIKKLQRMESDGHDASQALENSIINGWQGVFDPDPPRSSSNGTTSSGHTNKPKSATERFWERRAGQIFDYG